MDTSYFGCFFDISSGSEGGAFGHCVSDVKGDGCGEDLGCLRDDSDERAEGGSVEGGDV